MVPCSTLRQSPTPTQRSVASRETAFVVAEMKMRPDLTRVVVDAESQIVVEQSRIDDFARIHFPVGIPDLLEFPKGLASDLAEHLR